MSPPRAPDWLAGLWRREALILADGTQDRTTRVLWGQTHSLYVDIRIPADRPVARGRRSFDEFTAAELLRLADQKGFAGHVVMEGDICNWIRYVDYQPNTGRPDRGRLWLEGETLLEEGEPSSVIGSAYREIYHRERKADPRSVALRLLDEVVDGFAVHPCGGAVLVLVDDRFLFARGRTRELPKAETLRDVIAAAGDDRAQVHACLDCEISFGRLDSDSGWTIETSTIPFREGQRLLPRGSAEVSEGHDVLTVVRADGVQRWSIVESTVAPRDLAGLFKR